MMRVGIGEDLHRVDDARTLVLGGVIIEEGPGLSGHSDADVLLHAITDAVLGAAALGDIGHHFPPGDARFRNADSMELLRHAVKLIAAARYRIVNVDATVVAEAPKLAPHVAAMRAALAEALGIDAGAVSVKATTSDGLGATGRGEGIAALAVALLDST